MHFCADCRWTGEFPNFFKTDAERIQTLLALQPGAAVPSGTCPACSGNTLPEALGEIAIPEAAERNRMEPLTGSRWTLQAMQGHKSLVIYLQDRAKGLMTEIDIDSSLDRVRLEVTAFKAGENMDEAESQILLSIGDGHVACYPTADELATPIVYTADGAAPGALMDLARFRSLSQATLKAVA